MLGRGKATHVVSKNGKGDATLGFVRHSKGEASRGIAKEPLRGAVHCKGIALRCKEKQRQDIATTSSAREKIGMATQRKVRAREKRWAAKLRVEGKDVIMDEDRH